MNIVELTNKIKEIANDQPMVMSVFDGDVYENWNAAETKYASVNVALESATYEGQSVTYAFILYYGDRLQQNNLNRNEIWSDGVRILQSIINQLDNEYHVEIPETIIYTPFEQHFFDYLAGVYTTVNITVDSELGLCGIDDLDE